MNKRSIGWAMLLSFSVLMGCGGAPFDSYSEEEDIDAGDVVALEGAADAPKSDAPIGSDGCIVPPMEELCGPKGEAGTLCGWVPDGCGGNVQCDTTTWCGEFPWVCDPYAVDSSPMNLIGACCVALDPSEICPGSCGLVIDREHNCGRELKCCRGFADACPDTDC